MSMPASQPDRVKSAATYLLQGKVQGVGLRKKLHRILDDLNRPGLAFNNARTGEVLASIPGRARQREKVLKLLAERMAEEGLVEGEDYRVTPLTKRVASQPVTLDEEAIRRFSELQGFTRLPQAPLEYQKKWLKDRYRLQEDDSGALVGRVPELARRQLLEGEPIYDYQLVPGWANTPTKTAGHVKLAAGLGRLISQALRGTARGAARSAGHLTRLPLKYPKTTAGIVGTAPLWKPLWDKATSQSISSHLNEKWRLDRPEHASPLYATMYGTGAGSHTPIGAYRRYADALDSASPAPSPKAYLYTPLYLAYPRGTDHRQAGVLVFPEPHHQQYLQQRYLSRLARELHQDAPSPGSSAWRLGAEHFNRETQGTHPASPHIANLLTLHRLWQATGHPHYRLLLQAYAAKAKSPDPSP